MFVRKVAGDPRHRYATVRRTGQAQILGSFGFTRAEIGMEAFDEWERAEAVRAERRILWRRRAGLT